ncbi:MAG: hypothetical protein ABR577_03055 [Pyrinomonadaceae bacterium]
MNKLKCHRTVLLCAFACCLILANFNVAAAQSTPLTETITSAKSIEVNHEVQLYLLVASNKAGEKSDVPQAVDGVIRQLKSSLPFANYKLTTTFLNRVRDGGNLQVSGIVGNAPFAPSTSSAPTFYEFTLGNIRLITDAAGQQFVKIERFRFGQKVPVQTSTARGENGVSVPALQYENTGITTEVSLREAAPTVIGIMPAGQPGELFILVASVKRIASR